MNFNKKTNYKNKILKISLLLTIFNFNFFSSESKNNNKNNNSLVISIETSKSSKKIRKINLPQTVDYFYNKDNQALILSWIQSRNLSVNDLKEFINTLFAYYYSYIKHSSKTYIEVDSDDSNTYCILDFMLQIMMSYNKQGVEIPANYVQFVTNQIPIIHDKKNK